MEHETCLSHYVYICNEKNIRENKMKVKKCVFGLEVIWLTVTRSAKK
jgi:hypothetical protein